MICVPKVEKKVFKDFNSTAQHCKKVTFSWVFQLIIIHNIWIEYDHRLKLTEGQNPIMNWYCTCKTGTRILGMCAHITSVIWFLGVGRHNNQLKNPRKCDFFAMLCIDAYVSLIDADTE